MSQEILASAFNPKDDRLIVTLAGQPDLTIMLWQWENGKCLAKQQIGMKGGVDGYDKIPFQLSYNPGDMTASSVLVTGPSTFVYLKIATNEEKESVFNLVHTQINNLEEGRQLSDLYTCHSWARTGDLLVCTNDGEILICSHNGEYKSYFLGSPVPKSIATCLSHDSGFVIATEDNLMLIVTEDDDRTPLRMVGSFSIQIRTLNSTNSTQLTPLGKDESIICLATNMNEDQIFAITNSGQLIECRVDLRDDHDLQKDPEFEYVICPFHKSEVTGLDVCIRKQLIATCSKDKTVCIWNYNTMQLETKPTLMGEECLAVAFHPSGLHLLVSLKDKINICNVLSREIKISKQPIAHKHCYEISFSHGGQLFACAAGGNIAKEIHIYNFYTNECPQ